MFSTGRVLKSVTTRHSHRPWLPTERLLAAEFLLVALAIRTLSSGICLNLRMNLEEIGLEPRSSLNVDDGSE
jgi:hypothetical protein